MNQDSTRWAKLIPERDVLVAQVAVKQQRIEIINDRHEIKWLKEEIAKLITRIEAYNSLIAA